jgi:NAD+ synthase
MQNDKIVQHIVTWLTKYAKTANAQGFIVGVSGGVDSALTSTLCALTNLKTICINMPLLQKNDQFIRAKNHINWLQKKFPNVLKHEIDLTKTFETLKSTLPLSSSTHLLSMANTRARLRMTTLYAVGQSENALVVGTGNKIEDFGVGFFTKYGDGGVDISPIADITKTQVFELAKYLKVNNEIIIAAPTDGLWDEDHTDEHQLGATYAELEWAMDFIIQNLENDDFDFAQSDNYKNLSVRQKEVLAIYSKFHYQNKHKMIPIPVCEIPKELF